ncbi:MULTISPECIES: zinc-dependent metalloprotease [Butyricimonas]|uniref:zinc-dependent metalloprotease n=1 Tax=Butyricimonas TaxID=574697 RepID=UPI001D08AC7A|nr:MULTISPECIES: zinc-dependent metalloprotease [Butyricimonas]MCB6974291.1 zinc-dependent metalloprotease [Butyricimonas synergistica]MCG4521149.1 zinc-dependent metalloprotease [Butyricimonas sp. DFI.6.44]
MKNCFVLVMLLSLLIPSAGESYAGELFKKKKKKEATEEVKRPVVKKKNKYETLMKSPGIVTAKGDFLTIHKVGQKIYLEYPLKYMDREILVGGTVSATSEPMLLNVGYKYNDPILYRVVKKDSAIVFNRPNLAATAGEDKPWVKKAMEKNYIDIPARAFSIHSYNADSSAVVIDVTSFIKEDKELAPKVSGGMITSSPVSSKFSFEGIKAFEDNASMEVSQPVEAYIVSLFGKINLGQVSTRSVITFLLLPEAKMKPRVQDSRVGVFFTVNSASDRMQFPIRKISQEKDGFDTYILANRWKVEPKDMEAWKRGELVEPVKPIVWYVDDAFPDEWRGPIKEGILIWNKAFEKIGFKNVMVAKDFPKDDPNFDPDNLKYTCIRYSPNAEANAMGPSWVDPTTGEIINASVIVYNNIVELINNWRFVQTAQLDPRVRASKMPKDVLDESIVYVISHEIGHTLGLMHNMSASASIPVDSLRSASFTQKYGTTPSIMDYARFNYVAQPGDKGVKLTPPELGVYDYYVIKWLYSPVPEAKDMWEEAEIAQKWIDEKAGDPFYRYGRQQLMLRIDPSALEEDLGDDPLKASTYGIKNLKYILSHLNEWIEDDVDYTHRMQLYKAIQSQYMRYLLNVLYQVGSVHLTQVKDGTAGEAVVSVPRAKQKEALAWVIKELRNSDWINLPELINQTGLAVYPSAKIVAGISKAIVAKGGHVILSSHVSKEKNPYTIGEFYDDLYAGVFAPTIQGRKLTAADRIIQENIFKNMAAISTKYLSNKGIQSLNPSLAEIEAYELCPKEVMEVLHIHSQNIEKEFGMNVLAREGLPVQFGQGASPFQGEVKIDAINNSFGYNQAMLKRVVTLLKGKFASANRDDRVHYEGLISVLEEMKKK